MTKAAIFSLSYAGLIFDGVPDIIGYYFRVSERVQGPEAVEKIGYHV